MATAYLAERGVIEVVGAEARAFLDRLVTCDLDRVAMGRARYGALLSPQGKILADFIVVQGDAGGELFRLDAPVAAIPDLVKRLTLYRLRAKVTVRDVSGDLGVLAGWDASAPDDLPSVSDPRDPALGWRAIVPVSAAESADDPGAYEAHRIGLGIPESGSDFALGDAFPHEALMDQLAGVDFDKGCYVGQEVVSRMQHRGTARTRLVSVAAQSGTLVRGTDVVAGERVLGRIGSVVAGRGLAMIRLDRAADALGADVPIEAGGTRLRFEKPARMRFAYPADMMSPAA